MTSVYTTVVNAVTGQEDAAGRKQLLNRSICLRVMHAAFSPLALIRTRQTQYNINSMTKPKKQTKVRDLKPGRDPKGGGAIKLPQKPPSGGDNLQPVTSTR
jgi:hypothetical protein